MMDQARIDTLRAQPVPTPETVTGTRRVGAAERQALPVLSPVDGKQFSDLPEATAGDVRDAIAAARARIKL